jgi:ubiquinone/menaquinone biosynthesis C-methylase UbiE
MMKQEKDWSTFAEEFDQLQEYIAGKETLAICKEHIASLPPLGNLVEFGCGNGTYTKPAATVATRVTATDIAEDMINIARIKLGNHQNVCVEQRDCYASTYPDSAFDTVLMANLIHVVHKPATALKEAHRILQDNGRLVLLSFTADGMKFFDILGLLYRYVKMFGTPPKKGTRFTLASLTEFVNTHGFSVQDASLIGHKTKAIFLVAKKQS